jgi:HPt (histidine-containing phosphotransfer) domain-containing protein
MQRKDSAAVFDVKTFSERFKGDKGVMAQAVDAFLDEAPGRLEEVGRAIATQDFKTVGQQARALKASSGYLCGRRMSLAAMELEAASMRSDKECLQPMFAALRRHFEALKSAMAPYAGKGIPSQLEFR